MFKLIERIQYSFIHTLYKGKVYKAGKGYFYRANHMISIPCSMLVALIIRGLFSNSISHKGFAFIFLVLGFISMFLLECNVTKKKLCSSRPAYRNKELYTKYYLLILFLLLICNAIVWKAWKYL